MLVRWFKAKYPDVPIPEETVKAIGTNSSWDTHERITQLFMELARWQHGQNQMDPDLQIAMGVLFYTNGDYERAQDCFVAALNVRPKVMRFTLSQRNATAQIATGLFAVEQAWILAFQRK